MLMAGMPTYAGQSMRSPTTKEGIRAIRDCLGRNMERGTL